MTRYAKLAGFFLFFSLRLYCQTLLYRDTIPVFEQDRQLMNPWAGGINFSSFSSVDLNLDGKPDLVTYDKICGSGGKLKTFLNVGSAGEARYKHEPMYQKQLPAITEWALFFDYNNDGKNDLYTYTTGGIRVYQNTSHSGQLAFTLAKPILWSDYNPNGAPNMSNIYSNPVGTPGIADIDGDGDLDILTYSVFGIKMEYHQNMSKELYGHSDSLVFDMVDNCWGDVQESNCELFLEQCPYMKRYQETINPSTQKVLHAGSCIMCFDRDNDGDQELILGDISCSDVFFAENTGNAANNHIGDTTKLYPNYPNKAVTNRIKMNSFPCTYYLDVNNDGFKDLIASPNAIAGSENYQSVWYYKNTSTTPTVNFVMQQKNFLQEDMIEVGEGAYPVLFDADADGKKDLIIGNLGYYTGNTNKSKLAYYRNIGTATAPSFSLITRDYQTLSTYTIYSMAPTFGDLDHDGDEDLIIGDYNGQLHYFENTAGPSHPAIFSRHIHNYQNLDVGNYAYPQLYDLDKNGTLDLVVGSQNGKITFIKNTGTVFTPTFNLQTSVLGGINVRQYGYATGYSVPYAYETGGITKLLVGSEIGNLYLYDGIDGNLGGSFNRVDTNLYNINEGTRSAPVFEDITGDGLRDLLIGNYAGGVAFFNSKNINGVGVKEQQEWQEVLVFPNPANQVINIAIRDALYDETTITLRDVLGKELWATKTFNQSITVDVSCFSTGMYFITFEKTQSSHTPALTKKILIQ